MQYKDKNLTAPGRHLDKHHMTKPASKETKGRNKSTTKNNLKSIMIEAGNSRLLVSIYIYLFNKKVRLNYSAFKIILTIIISIVVIVLGFVIYSLILL